MVGHGTLHVGVAGADVPAILEVACGTEFPDEGGFPVEIVRWGGSENAGQVFDGEIVDAIPVGPIDVEFDVPVFIRTIGVAKYNRFREGEIGFGVVFSNAGYG